MIPMELITFLGSTLLGGALKMWGAKQQAEADKHSRMMDALTAVHGQYTEIRNNTQPQFTWTRRFIAVSAVLSIVVLPKVAAVLLPGLPVTIGWTEWVPGFWPFTSGQNHLVWHVAQGLTITPLDTHLVSSIAGLYFGGSLTGHRG